MEKAEKEKLLAELKEEFDKTKKILGFKSSYEDIERIFFLEDMIIRENYVSPRFSRQLCGRILDTYNSWVSYMNYLIVPSAGSIISMMENKMLSEEDRKIISDILKKVLELTSRNTLIGLTKDQKEEAKFIDDSVNMWENNFKPEMIKILTKLNASWGEEKVK